MYHARHSGWLGPSAHIQPYPQLDKKKLPAINLKLAFGLPFILILAIVGVNLLVSHYARTQVAYWPADREIKAISSGSPQTLSAVIASDEDSNSGLKMLLNDWSEQKTGNKWSVAVRGLGSDNRAAGLNGDLLLPGVVIASSAHSAADQLVHSYLDGTIFSMIGFNSSNRGISAGCAGCRILSSKVEGTSFRHEAAIVRYVGGEYLLVVYTDGASYSQIAQLAAKVHSVMVKR